MSESIKDWNLPLKIKLDDLIIIGESIFKNFKVEPGLSQSSDIISSGSIQDKIVIDNSLFILCLILIFVSACDEHINVGLYFPKSTNSHLKVIDAIFDSKSVDSFYCLHLSNWVIF